MQRDIGLDVHSASGTLAVAVRMIPGENRPAFEGGLQSAWLYEMPRSAEGGAAGEPMEKGR